MRLSLHPSSDARVARFAQIPPEQTRAQRAVESLVAVAKSFQYDGPPAPNQINKKEFHCHRSQNRNCSGFCKRPVILRHLALFSHTRPHSQRTISIAGISSPPRETSADKPITPEQSSLSSNPTLLSAYRTRTVSAEATFASSSHTAGSLPASERQARHDAPSGSTRAGAAAGQNAGAG